ncbi:MAG: arginine--tRNA ligase [Fibrobacter sp.]|nr:arginine--tRNA ligase [Fibrobacter sp.]
MKEVIVSVLTNALSGKLTDTEIERLLEIPPDETMGDYAFPCFSLSKVLRKSPVAIANELSAGLVLPEEIEKVTVVNGYLNFYVNKVLLSKQVLANAVSDDFGRTQRNRKIVIEFSSPNSNKPLHLGHLRNMSIGESVSRILSFCGNEVIKTSINNDRGVHICKSMIAYKQFGEGKTPESTGKKSDHFVGDYYVLFSKEAAKDETWNEKAQELLRKWEDGDKETVELWKKMNSWAFEGFRKTYKLFGISFDKEYYESQIYKSGKEIVKEGLDKNLFSRRDDGAVFVDLQAEKLGEKVLLRPDGTSVYIVQDLYLAVLKDQEFNYDQSIYVVGNEQDYHFAVLIAIFRKLGYPIADKMKHLSYGMVELPEGKMKSREGTVVDADDLITETQKLAAEELKERYTLSEDEMKDRSLKIALSAIKYQLLKVDITKTMLFDPKKAISFEGDTGPYLLYSYARSASIIRKAGELKDAPVIQPLPPEIRLIKKLAYFPAAVSNSCDKLSPSLIANYAFELAQSFNEFYHECKVIGSEQEAFRLHIVNAFRSVLKKCLHLLGIEEIEEM